MQSMPGVNPGLSNTDQSKVEAVMLSDTAGQNEWWIPTMHYDHSIRVLETDDMMSPLDD